VRGLAVLVCAALAVVAAGCGGGSKSSSASSAKFAAQTSSQRSGEVLKIFGFSGGDDVAQNREAFTKKALAPAKVSTPPGNFDPQRFLTQWASGSIPDLVYLDRQQVATLAAKKALTPLDQCVSAQHIDLSQYNKAALKEATYQGQLYALPEFTNQRTLIVNRTAVKQAGLSLSDVSTTSWSKLAQVTKKLTVMQGDRPTRLGFDPKLPEFFILWAHANGATLLSADGLHAQLDSPKAVQALTFTKSLIDEQGGWAKFKSFRDTWDFFGAKNQVAKDQVGAWPMESWYWNVLAQNSPNVDVAAVPFTDRHGKPFTYVSGNGWAIPAGAKNAALACTWMKTMTGVRAWMVAATKRAAATKKAGQPFTGLYTANTAADTKILGLIPKQSNEWTTAVRTLTAVQQEDAVYWSASPAGAQVQQALSDAIQRVLDGTQKPAAALKQAQTQAQQAITSAANG
jgi:multiple sugar transport system substrate-binding protein